MIRTRIGIVSWNTRVLLDDCLRALPAATDGLDVDVVVVDNDSSDGSSDVAEAHPGVMVIRNASNVGYARAMNQALAAPGSAAPEVLVALNPDTVPPPRSLTALAQTLEASSDLGLVVPQLMNPDGTVQHSVYRFPTLRLAAVVGLTPIRLQRGRLARRWWLEGLSDHGDPCDIDWAIGAVHAIKAAALGGRSPYSERWFMYVEDLDLCWQLAQSGWRRRLEPSVAVMHVGNASGRLAWGDERTARWLDASYDWYRLRHGAGAAWLWAVLNTIGVAAHIAGAVPYRIVRGRWPSGAQVGMLRRTLRLHAASLVPHRTRSDLDRAPSFGQPPRTSV
jgi:GT2 family glycosyltransferase